MTSEISMVVYGVIGIVGAALVLVLWRVLPRWWKKRALAREERRKAREEAERAESIRLDAIAEKFHGIWQRRAWQDGPRRHNEIVLVANLRVKVLDRRVEAGDRYVIAIRPSISARIWVFHVDFGLWTLAEPGSDLDIRFFSPNEGVGWMLDND